MLSLQPEEDFVRNVEIYKETLKFRETKTKGGFYCEADMRKPVSEGGLGFSSTLNFYGG